MPTQVWLHVHVGYPHDYADSRHVNLFFVFPNKTQCVMHVIGWPGKFYFDLIDNYNPLASRTMASRIFVAEIPDTYSRSAIRDIVSGTRVKNGPKDSFWDCQQWVCDALVRLVKFGALTKHQKDRSIDNMIYACLEARDEGMPLLRKQAKIQQAIIERAMTDEEITEKEMTEQASSEESFTEQAKIQQAIIDKAMTDEEITEEEMTEKVMIEETKSNS